jgi:hypothetical protein
MKSIKQLCALMLGLCCFALLAADLNSTHILEAREIVNQFFGSLKGELQAALQEGGPVTAISICKLKAPRLTKEFSSLSGWYIARTALKLRNQNNHPDDWEKRVMEEFEVRKANGESLQNMEYSEVVTVEGKKIFRYMQAIEVKELCLNCHGQNIKPEIRRILRQLYPNDLATGFEKGDFRGAFTLAKSLENLPDDTR